MAVFAQRLTISGVEDERKQLRDFSLVVRFLCWIATTFAQAVGIVKNLSRPSLPTRVSLQSPADDVDDALDPVALPVRMVRTTEVLAHPLAMTSGRTKTVLRSDLGGRAWGNTAWRATDDLATLFTGNGNYQMTGAPRRRAAGITTKLASAPAKTYPNGLLAHEANSRGWLYYSQRFIDAQATRIRAVLFPALSLKFNSTALAGFHNVASSISC